MVFTGLETSRTLESARKLLKISVSNPKSPSDLTLAYLLNLLLYPHPSFLHFVTEAAFCSRTHHALSLLRGFAFAAYLCQDSLSSSFQYLDLTFSAELSYHFLQLPFRDLAVCMRTLCKAPRVRHCLICSDSLGASQKCSLRTPWIIVGCVSE